MKIRFYPSPASCIDQIIVDVSGKKKWFARISFSFFPVYCWSWEWSLEASKTSKAWYIKTPSMTIRFYFSD